MINIGFNVGARSGRDISIYGSIEEVDTSINPAVNASSAQPRQATPQPAAKRA